MIRGGVIIARTRTRTMPSKKTSRTACSLKR